MITLKSPNPDTNGVKVEGYDRIERNKATGLFEVHDSNLALKLQGQPWNFVTVASAVKKAAPAVAKKVEVEEKTIAEMSKQELADWINERSSEADQVDKKDYNLDELRELATAIKTVADSKSNNAEGQGT